MEDALPTRPLDVQYALGLQLLHERRDVHANRFCRGVEGTPAERAGREALFSEVDEMPEGPSADEVWKGDGGSASGLLREILSLELFAAAGAALAVTMARDAEVRTHPLKGRLRAEADCREVALHVDDFVPDADVRDALGVLHALDLASTAVHRYELADRRARSSPRTR